MKKAPWWLAAVLGLAASQGASDTLPGCEALGPSGNWQFCDYTHLPGSVLDGASITLKTRRHNAFSMTPATLKIFCLNKGQTFVLIHLPGDPIEDKDDISMRVDDIPIDTDRWNVASDPRTVARIGNTYLVRELMIGETFRVEIEESSGEYMRAIFSLDGGRAAIERWSKACGLQSTVDSVVLATGESMLATQAVVAEYYDGDLSALPREILFSFSLDERGAPVGSVEFVVEGADPPDEDTMRRLNEAIAAAAEDGALDGLSMPVEGQEREFMFAPHRRATE